MNYTINNKKLIDILIAISLIVSCIPGWYVIESFGMNRFWAVFAILSCVAAVLIIKSCLVDKKLNKRYIKNGFNLLVICYMVWIFISYFMNGRDLSTILYIGKLDFLIIIYFFILGMYLYTQTKKENLDTILMVSSYIFKFGGILCLVALYQYIFNTNYILGYELTFWPPFNPAAFYQNVNGFGMYLYLSIISGLIYMYNKRRHSGLNSALLVVQYYVLYLTVARTSIIVAILFTVMSILITLIMKKSELFRVINKGVIIGFVIANIIMAVVVFDIGPNIDANINDTNQNPKTSLEMLEEKNSKGLNYRGEIWSSVIRNYKDYMLLGDGLNYNVVKKTNINEIINKSSDKNTRISYHNTLIRYYASNGLLGLILFLMLMLYGPFMLLFKMIKDKKLKYSYLIVMVFQLSILLYMQMEEVYIGEIGLIQVINIISLVYANSLILKDEVSE
ncbi:O-antigen ligase family protein [Clostridium fungisolvens]|uniref:O-antigen ligase-related domain-containing protein n=1 Tax=Clostridium fungisolvens TaxID=1604897 RepID=A0A6V8SFQ5_9CLOT|nr:O-antigen ligase family protein [Clostridium fungisolvens]GFP73968.1 hypothetical protein bsdtw1_00004 [Clostridium fungisolvens]